MQRLFFMDFETYYDKEYSLRKMTPAEYILDPKFEALMLAVKEGAGDTYIVEGKDILPFLLGLDASECTVVTFNSLFDNSILAWRYNWVPARMIDMMGVARSVRGHLLERASLEYVLEKLGSPIKKGNYIASALGKHRADFAPNEWAAFCDYAKADVDGTAWLFSELIGEYPESERRIMDLVLRATIVPRLRIDTAMLRVHLAEVEQAKTNLLNGARLCVGGVQITKKDLMSNAKFEALLTSLGVEVEYKISPTTHKPTPAFAKTDEFMETLQDNEDQAVQALAMARLGLKSTIEETRGRKLLAIGELPWPVTYGSCPVPLRIGGAHTHRLSGDWGLNLQNLPARTVGSKLRKALVAPDGCKVLVADLAQIECRVNAWICGQRDLLDVFARGEDPYCRLATEIFGKTVTKADKLERMIGKTGELGLGFGCGDEKFYAMVIRSARAFGMELDLNFWTPELSSRSVRTYRDTHQAIYQSWRHLDNLLEGAWVGSDQPRRWGPVVIGPGCVEMPNGMYLRYVVGGSERGALTYSYARVRRARMYGPKFLENIVQALARIILMNAAARLADRGLRFCLQAHDELGFVVPDEYVDVCKALVLEELTRPPTWAPDLPIAAEASFGQSYGDAK